MGKRGPAKTPSNLRLLRGDKSAAKSKEPVPSAGSVKPPVKLSEGARRKWNRLAPDLIDKGLLTPWDVDQFSIVCEALETWRIAIRELRSDGEVISEPVFSRNGDLVGHRQKRSPWADVRKKAEDTVHRYGARFGMNPSDRQDLEVDRGEEENDSERLLS